MNGAQRTEALPNDAMPCGLVSAIKVLLYERCDVLFDVVRLQCLDVRQHCVRLIEACMQIPADGMHAPALHS